ncbi:hypothetical protein C8N30_3849 [Sulfitobacter guttiformis]|uniref:Uncharacterized protein n=1 Tax=Sulfitobacter guttiformis TaxID=74349 RepID=A0A420DG76_9RHOB|nr:hypothetical protein C8N30_3849 [Sulfitobacter guttiformis]
MASWQIHQSVWMTISLIGPINLDTRTIRLVGPFWKKTRASPDLDFNLEFPTSTQSIAQ